MPSSELNIRELKSSEHPLVYNAWIKRCNRLNEIARQEYARYHIGDPPVTSRVLCEGLHKQIENLLSRPSCIAIAVDVGEDTLAGFLIAERATYSLLNLPTLHWVFVKERLRRCGVGSNLLRLAGIPSPCLSTLTCTQRTPEWSAFSRGLKIPWHYDPYRI